MKYVLNLPISSEDMDTLHMAYNGKSKPKRAIVKFISHKINTGLCRKRIGLRNVKILM